MGTIKDGIDTGIEALQFWRRFKGKRVRVWPSDLTIRICSESHKKRVTSADGREPPWWQESRRKYSEQQKKMPSISDPLVKFATDNLANADLPNIETVEEAKLLEATISDVTKNPPGIYLIDIQYWVVTGKPSENQVEKIDSTDEGMFLPLNQLARIDFVPPVPFAHPGTSSWQIEGR